MDLWDLSHLADFSGDGRFRRMAGDDVVAQGVKARMVASKHDTERGPMDDVTRYPEPDDRPVPHAQWDEIRGVWEVWNDTTQTWDELGTPLNATAGVPDGSPVPVAGVFPTEADHQAAMNHTEFVARATGMGGDVAKTFIQAEAIERIEEEGAERLAEIANAPRNPDGIRYPEPSARPDPHAQWDEHEGVWKVWDPGETAWVTWSADAAP